MDGQQPTSRTWQILRRKAAVELLFIPIANWMVRFGARIVNAINSGTTSAYATMHRVVVITFPDKVVAFLEGDAGSDGRLLLSTRVSHLEEEPSEPQLRIFLGMHDIKPCDILRIVTSRTFMRLGLYDQHWNNCQRVAFMLLQELGVPAPRDLQSARSAISRATVRASAFAAVATAVAAARYFFW
ncbi:hypothetical protein HPB52_020225 [Rhipicephalus sanguineus]|uniref:Uncharacterized protein n=1 Tax=Rhipicephalus sanguineus TaxID=34632 RepID=A0A9D4PQB4_RHISA|nr:hypothetical protein HPB52_020225 [Rhipicephalus sanguineus]